MKPTDYHLKVFAFFYRHLVKPVFFLTNPEKIHVLMTLVGEKLGQFTVTRNLFSGLFVASFPSLFQEIAGVSFKTPIGLAAGFDYEARLTQILPSLGFGFGTVGTITNLPFEGNPRPRLGRLPLSRSLLVNKGFKNDGVKALLKKLTPLKFLYPVGISIGKTNISQINTLESAILDIFSSFSTLLNSSLKPSYLELNISCPNLSSHVDFYHPDRFQKLLKKLDELRFTIPVFVKMPISKTDHEVIALLEVAKKYQYIKGVIIGNLQTNRQHPSLLPSEVQKFTKGNFSGAPTFDRSNEIIALVYKNYKHRFVIIGCGGVFSVADAYKKIKLGASLVQLITGMIFEGPQLIAQINYQLDKFLNKDGYYNISQAVGSEISLQKLY